MEDVSVMPLKVMRRVRHSCPYRLFPLPPSHPPNTSSSLPRLPSTPTAHRSPLTFLQSFTSPLPPRPIIRGCS